jgi:MbtH protein
MFIRVEDRVHGRRDVTMSNPFDDPDGQFFVLVNEEGQHSLWPDFASVPAGWTAAFGAAEREARINHVNTNSTDMRPRGLIIQMSQAD